jgi:hypothetical protein
MTDYVVETGIEIPLKNSRAHNGRVHRYKVLLDLEVNQSILFPREEADTASRAASDFSMLYGIRFTRRMTPDKKGVRIWRIE